MKTQPRENPSCTPPGNTAISVMDKMLGGKITRVAHPDPDSLLRWAGMYYQIHVSGSPPKTEAAKQSDLRRFLLFYSEELGHDRVDGWTPAVTKHFQRSLATAVSPITKQPYKATTVNRVMATVRHFGTWLHKRRPLLAGSPLAGVKDIAIDAAAWNGLTNRQIMRLKAACEQRLRACARADQDPILERAVFLVLLNTGLRESELCSLDLSQYHHRGFHQVARKGSRVSAKVPVPAEAKEALDAYLASREIPETGPIFVTRYGRRIAAQDVARICDRLCRQACAQVDEEERFHLTPHMLRHTLLKRVADKHGVHVAQQMSGNISIREVFRYTKPSQDEVDETSERVFE
jgi:integrase/recombinase XerD